MVVRLKADHFTLFCENGLEVRSSLGVSHNGRLKVEVRCQETPQLVDEKENGQGGIVMLKWASQFWMIKVKSVPCSIRVSRYKVAGQKHCESLVGDVGQRPTCTQPVIAI